MSHMTKIIMPHACNWYIEHGHLTHVGTSKFEHYRVVGFINLIWMPFKILLFKVYSNLHIDVRTYEITLIPKTYLGKSSCSPVGFQRIF